MPRWSVPFAVFTFSLSCILWSFLPSCFPWLGLFHPLSGLGFVLFWVFSATVFHCLRIKRGHLLSTKVLLWLFFIATAQTFHLLLMSPAQLINARVTSQIWTLPEDSELEKLLTTHQPFAFFYTSGLWPDLTENSAYHELIYEKGPPGKFIGKIIAHWPDSQAKVLIAGPETPKIKDRPDNLRSCILGQDFHLACARFKAQLLQTTQSLLTQSQAKHFTMTWLDIQNPAVALHELPSGIWIRSHHTGFIQDHFLLFSLFGVCQRFVLKHPTQEFTSFLRLKTIISSMRMATNHHHLRPLTDLALEEVHIQPKSSLPELLFASTTLLSKLSVDPANYDGYYHFAGVNFLLSQRLSKNSEDSFMLPVLIQNIKAATRFAYDINPEDPRNLELEHLCHNLTSQ